MMKWKMDLKLQRTYSRYVDYSKFHTYTFGLTGPKIC